MGTCGTEELLFGADDLRVKRCIGSYAFKDSPEALPITLFSDHGGVSSFIHTPGTEKLMFSVRISSKKGRPWCFGHLGESFWQS